MISQSIQNCGAKGTETQNFCSSCEVSLLAIRRHLHLVNTAVSPESPAVVSHCSQLLTIVTSDQAKLWLSVLAHYPLGGLRAWALAQA